MQQSSLADWLFDRDLDVSDFDERPMRAKRRSETRAANLKLIEHFSKLESIGQPLTIPTHFIRKPKLFAVLALLVILGVLGCAFAVDIWLRIVNLFSPAIFSTYGEVYGAVIAAQIVGFFLFYRAFFKPLMSSASYAMRQRLAVSAGEAVLQDRRPPIVLLRSFKSENFKVRVAYAERRRLEEVLAPLCKAIGPFIAIGKPKERNPQLGAARDYIPDDKWQETVLKWFDAASTILVIADETPGLKWELESLRKTGNARKVILINPHLPEERKIDLVDIVRQLWWGETDIGKHDNVDLGPCIIIHIGRGGVLRTIRDRYVRSAAKYRAAFVAALSTIFVDKQTSSPKTTAP